VQEVSAVSDLHSVVHDRVLTLFSGMLRSAQLRGWTDDTLAEQSGVAARTIKSYRVEGKEPSLSNALAIAAVLGPTAINSVLATVGYGRATSLDDEPEANVAGLIAQVLPHVSTLAAAVADGRIDHAERPGVQAAADAIIAAMAPLSSAAQTGG
jgi:predicted transcriptional regulator